MKKILLTGANGYIGKRILPVLINKEYDVYAVVRDPNRIKIPKEIAQQVTLLKADLLNEDDVNNLPTDIDLAYFLVHSMSGGSKFSNTEQKIAENFKHYLDKTQAKQCIYLSGISNDDDLSEHLKSRLDVEEILSKSKVPVTILRAAIIIGSGSASFEIIRDLTEKLPLMIAPKWIDNYCQPIAVKDVIYYLTEIIDKEKALNQIFDIGGPEVLTYKQMMLEFAKERQLKRYIYTVPVMTPKLSSYWLYFITSTSYPLAQNLVDSLKNNAVCEIKGIDECVPLNKTSYNDALKLAFQKIEQNAVASSWKDAMLTDKINNVFSGMIEIPKHGCLKDERRQKIEAGKVNEVLDKIWSIGGDNGWYYMNWAWKIRGLIDKMVGGVGVRRGRRSPTDLAVGDALDFWRVILADKKEKRLILYAEMKLPGEAWLEFSIQEDKNGEFYVNQNATFRPLGVSGRLYWYSLVPAHFFIFGGMLKKIVKT